MHASSLKKPLLILLLLAALWLGCKFVLPVLLPFLLGALVALAAEPMVSVGVKRLHMRRGLAAGVGVTLTLVFLAGIVSVVAAVAVKELGNLAGAVPDLEQGTVVLQDWLVSLADRAPEGVRTLAQRTVLDFFDNGSALMEQVSSKLPGVVTSVVSGVGDSVLSIGTGVLSAYLISARFPKLRSDIVRRLPQSWYEKYLPALKRVRHSLGGWLKAQGKLSLVTWGIVTVGFFVLGVSYAPAWAALVALVDAVPVLGTGTVLVPWAVVCFLQGDSLRAVGLLCTYGAAAVTRTVLEPRLVGRQLGLDPLGTLVALYVGYRLWGIPGLLLTPILASAAKSLAEGTYSGQKPENRKL